MSKEQIIKTVEAAGFEKVSSKDAVSVLLTSPESREFCPNFSLKIMECFTMNNSIRSRSECTY